MKEVRKLAAGLVLCFTAFLFGRHYLFPSPFILVFEILAIVLFSFGWFMIFATVDFREIGLWLRWRKAWWNWDFGPYYFPETENERKRLKRWAEDQLARRAGWVSNAEKIKAYKAKILEDFEPQFISLASLKSERVRTRRAEEDLAEATKMTDRAFQSYYRLVDLFKEMGMVRKDLDPEEFRKAREAAEASAGDMRE